MRDICRATVRNGVIFRREVKAPSSTFVVKYGFNDHQGAGFPSFTRARHFDHKTPIGDANFKTAVAVPLRSFEKNLA